MTEEEQKQSADAVEATGKRLHELAGDIADLMADLIERMEEMHTVGATALEIKALCQEAAKQPYHEVFFYSMWAELFPAAAYESDGGSPMRRLIGRLFRDAPKLQDASGKDTPGQTPVVSDVTILLRGTPQPVGGALSMTPEGTLRVGTPAQMKLPSGQQKVVLMEQFFTAEDVVMIAVPRDVPPMIDSLPRIIRPH